MKVSLSMRPKYLVSLAAGLVGLFTVVTFASTQRWAPTCAIMKS